MQLHYHKAAGGNFGDDLNEWMWDQLIPGFREYGNKEDVVIGLGSILHENRLSKYEGRISILGSGFNGGQILKSNTRERCRFYSVRGPLTRDALKLDARIPLLDPGSVIPDIYKAAEEQHGKILFIPHHKNTLENATRFNLEAAVAEAGLEFLSPAIDSKKVLEKISGSSLVVTESLHGAIIADAYRVPWVPVKFGPRFTPFKWHDWSRSLDIELKFIDMFPLPNRLYKFEGKFPLIKKHGKRFFDWRNHADRFGKFFSDTITKNLMVASKSTPFLSNDNKIGMRKQAFYEAISSFKKDFGIA